MRTTPSTVFVLGRDAVGVVAEDRDTAGSRTGEPFRYYLTDCCGASAKGLEEYVGCRSCYREIDPALGDVPDKDMRIVNGKFEITPRPLKLLEVYGDGITYEEWRKVANLTGS